MISAQQESFFSWLVFSTKDRFACVGKVFGTKDRFTYVWIAIVFSTKDRFACVWKVFSTKDRSACGEGVRHQGQTEWTRPDDLKTEEEYQEAADLYRSEDYCLNLTRQKTSTKEEYQGLCGCHSAPQGDLNTTFPNPFTPGWSEESGVKCLSQGHNIGAHVQTCTGYDSESNLDADPETGLQQEEEPDFCRQGCMKEDGEG
ncbi:hypothetical protein Bbelb_211660 [Branchiostoma belcheri]|nr:hypothetical protein Bbelb_211660 [Branchiostoma belcheri]